MFDDNYELVQRPPTVAEYQRLRKSAGWVLFDHDATRHALDSALFSVCLLCGDAVVGCGRIVGDGGIYYYVQDVIVVPSLQGRGLGDTIMTHLMQWLEGAAPDRAFVALFSATGKAPFYERHGFSAREPERPGMSQYIRRP